LVAIVESKNRFYFIFQELLKNLVKNWYNLLKASNLVLTRREDREGIGGQIPLSTEKYLQFSWGFEKKSKKAPSTKSFPYKNFENTPSLTFKSRRENSCFSELILQNPSFPTLF